MWQLIHFLIVAQSCCIFFALDLLYGTHSNRALQLNPGLPRTRHLLDRRAHTPTPRHACCDALLPPPPPTLSTRPPVGRSDLACVTPHACGARPAAVIGMLLVQWCTFAAIVVAHWARWWNESGQGEFTWGMVWRTRLKFAPAELHGRAPQCARHAFFPPSHGL
eukprot:2290703-Prymnesium_polylepis.1